MAVSDWSTNPANNGVKPGINIPEGCDPGNVNDAIRQVMADVAALKLDILKSVYFVGRVICVTGVSLNPSDPSLLGFGTWVPFFEGRCPMGYGSSTDGNGITQGIGDAALSGEWAHFLTVAQLPSHSHSASGTSDTHLGHAHGLGGKTLPNYASGKGSTSGAFTLADSSSGQSNTDSGGAHSHIVSITVSSAGSGQALNLVPPVQGARFWKRIA